MVIRLPQNFGALTITGCNVADQTASQRVWAEGSSPHRAVFMNSSRAMSAVIVLQDSPVMYLEQKIGVFLPQSSRPGTHWTQANFGLITADVLAADWLIGVVNPYRIIYFPKTVTDCIFSTLRSAPSPITLSNTSPAAAATAGAAAAPIYIVVGPTNSGKSTFAQYLINTVLNRYPSVALLETDIGQSEVTPSGLVSLTLLTQPLYGPSNVHLRAPCAAHYLGQSSVIRCSPVFQNAVNALVDHYRTKVLTGNTIAIPLVVNTHGWVTTTGWSTTLRTIRHVQPTVIFVSGSCPMYHMKNTESELVSLDELNNIGGDTYDALLEQDGSTEDGDHQVMTEDTTITITVRPILDKIRVITLPPLAEQTTTASSRPFKDNKCRRENALLMYFAAQYNAYCDFLLPKVKKSTHVPSSPCLSLLPAFGDFLTDWLPYEASFDGLFVTFPLLQYATLTYGRSLPLLLNGALVGLVNLLTDNNQSNSGVQTTPCGLRILESYLTTSNCLGLGIVRRVDLDKHMLSVISPINARDMQRVNCLAVGTLSIPLSWRMTTSISASCTTASGEDNMPPSTDSAASNKLPPPPPSPSTTLPDHTPTILHAGHIPYSTNIVSCGFTSNMLHFRDHPM
jgi:hypothetical protein